MMALRLKNQNLGPGRDLGGIHSGSAMLLKRQTKVWTGTMAAPRLWNWCGHLTHLLHWVTGDTAASQRKWPLRNTQPALLQPFTLPDSGIAAAKLGNRNQGLPFLAAPSLIPEGSEKGWETARSKKMRPRPEPTRECCLGKGHRINWGNNVCPTQHSEAS